MTSVYRHIMETILGRPLGHDEVVHHIDNDRQNNSLENLQVMSRSAHASLKRGTIEKREMWKMASETHEPGLTVKETATLLGKSPRRIVQLIVAGQLPAVKWGRQWAILEEDAHIFRPRPVGRPKRGEK